MKQEYYFQQMNREEKQVYRAMYDGFTALSPEFPVLRLERKELSEIFFRLRLDHPAIFYVSSFTYRFFDQADYVHLIPEYLDYLLRLSLTKQTMVHMNTYELLTYCLD